MSPTVLLRQSTSYAKPALRGTNQVTSEIRRLALRIDAIYRLRIYDRYEPTRTDIMNASAAVSAIAVPVRASLCMASQ